MPPHISFSPAVVGQPKLFHQHQVPEELLLRFIIREICLSICGYEYVANIETHYVDHMIDPSSVSGYKNPKPMHQMAGLLDRLPRLSYLLNFPRGPSQLSMAHNSHPNTYIRLQYQSTAASGQHQLCLQHLGKLLSKNCPRWGVQCLHCYLYRSIGHHIDQL